jgi:hypothetical protein
VNLSEGVDGMERSDELHPHILKLVNALHGQERECVQKYLLSQHNNLLFIKLSIIFITS